MKGISKFSDGGVSELDAESLAAWSVHSIKKRTTQKTAHKSEIMSKCFEELSSTVWGLGALIMRVVVMMVIFLQPKSKLSCVQILFCEVILFRELFFQ